MGYIWVFLIVVSIIVGIINGRIQEVTQAIVDNAKLAVEISISLIGVMAFWLGLVKLAEKSGIISFIAKLVQPITNFLFPEIPKGHPSLGNIAMNVSANALGVTNAATPVGIKAMQALDDKSGKANFAMIMLIVINATSIQLLPTTVIGLRASAGSTNAADIILPTLIVTFSTTILGIFLVHGINKITKKIKLRKNQ